ncbi:MAG: hypothetical protein QGH06_05855 [Lutibacter sp.]|nr:hypothetical protein [Lutibacter sp.]
MTIEKITGIDIGSSAIWLLVSNGVVEKKLRTKIGLADEIVKCLYKLRVIGWLP